MVTAALAAHWPLVLALSVSYGVDPHLSLAMAFKESRGDASALGDNGCSVGLYQLNWCAGLGMGYTPEQLMDPQLNAEIAIAHLAATPRDGLTAGQWAARSQHPADPAGYAAAIDRLLPELRAAFALSGEVADGGGDAAEPPTVASLDNRPLWVLGGLTAIGVVLLVSSA